MKADPYVNVPIFKPVQKAFLVKRLHSITGLFFILFLIEHLLTNSEAAPFFGEDGTSFIRSVNFLQSLPYLKIIEIVALGIPLGIHALLGLFYLFSTVYNVFPSDGSTPSLPYSRNIAFTFQRLTALFLIVGLIAHVSSMRFINTPQKIPLSNQYALNVSPDQGLLALAPRLNSTVFTQESQEPSTESWTVCTPDFGTACLLLVRETFTSWYQTTLYTLFVIMSAFHAGNGLWTASITWGAAMNEQGRRLVRILSLFLITLLSAWGLSSIFGSFLLNQ